MKHFIKDRKIIQIKRSNEKFIKDITNGVSDEQIETSVKGFVEVIEVTKNEKSVLDFIKQTTKGKAKIEEIMENINREIENIAEIYNQAEKIYKEIIKIIKIKDRNSNVEFEIGKSVNNFIEEIEITNFKELEKELIKLAKDFIYYIGGIEKLLKDHDKYMKIDEIEKWRNSFINDMGITETEIKKSIKVFIKHVIEEFQSNQSNEALMEDPNYEIKEIVNDFIIKKKINKIKNELVKDFIERIVKIEDKSECTSQLGELLYYDFISRITKIEKLAKVPNIFRIKIGKDKLM